MECCSFLKTYRDKSNFIEQMILYIQAEDSIPSPVCLS
jgi:hypothetical protein